MKIPGIYPPEFCFYCGRRARYVCDEEGCFRPFCHEHSRKKDKDYFCMQHLTYQEAEKT